MTEIKELIKESIIKFLENTKTDDREKMNNVIGFLKRGWKLEEIMEELEEITTGKDIYANWLRSDIKRLTQKYFPKEIDNDKTNTKR